VHAVRRTGSASVRAERSGARRDVKYARSRSRGRASSTMTIYVEHGERHRFARDKLRDRARGDSRRRGGGDVVLYALHAARVTSRPAERRVGTRLAGRARRDVCLRLPASLPALDARRRDAQRRRRSRTSAESHELRCEPAVARSPPRRKGCLMRETMQQSMRRCIPYYWPCLFPSRPPPSLSLSLSLTPSLFFFVVTLFALNSTPTTMRAFVQVKCRLIPGSSECNFVHVLSECLSIFIPSIDSCLPF